MHTANKYNDNRYHILYDNNKEIRKAANMINICGKTVKTKTTAQKQGCIFTIIVHGDNNAL